MTRRKDQLKVLSGTEPKNGLKVFVIEGTHIDFNNNFESHHLQVAFTIANPKMGNYIVNNPDMRSEFYRLLRQTYREIANRKDTVIYMHIVFRANFNKHYDSNADVVEIADEIIKNNSLKRFEISLGQPTYKNIQIGSPISKRTLEQLPSQAINELMKVGDWQQTEIFD